MPKIQLILMLLLIPSLTLSKSIVGIVQEEKKKTQEKEQGIVKIYGGEVVVDGAVRAREPYYGKVFDLVETSTPTTPASNHVRLFAVQMGTWTAIKAIFDDGVIKTITNN